MQLDLSQLLTALPNCTWANSNQYFSDSADLRHIGFIGLFDTDIFIQTSFAIAGRIPITGALVQAFNKDNAEGENFILYSLPLKNVPTVGVIRIDLIAQDSNVDLLRKFLLSLPWVSLIIFYLLARVFPILNFLSLVATAIVVVIYAYAGLRLVIRLLRSKKITLAGQTVTYGDIQDIHALAEKHVQGLALLSQEGINLAAVYAGKLYLRQEINQKTLRKKPLPPEEIIFKVKNIINQLLSDNFIALWS